MVGQYALDDLDMFSTYGWVTAPGGSDDFLKFPDMKDVYSKDWADEAGTDVIVDQRYVKAKNISLQGALVADNEADFWSKHISFMNALIKPGLRRIYIDEFKRSFYIYYTACTAFTRLTRIQDNNGKMVIGCNFTLSFVEPVPSMFQSFSYLINKQLQYITTNNHNKIIV